jgi:hypothetical protein
MPITDEIYAAADRNGVSLAEYIRKTYSKKSLANLENEVQTQLDSLKGELSGFMGDVELPEIEANLMTAGKEKLDMMQARIRKNLVSRITELDDMLSTEISGTFAEGQEDFSTQGISGAYVPIEGLLTIE